MLLLAIGLLLIAGAISFFYFSYNNHESITVNWMDQTGVFPLAWIPYAILGLILFLLTLWILSQIFSVPKRMRRSGEVRDMKKSRDSLDRGLIEIQSGNFEKGEATLTSYTDRSPGDAVKYITAAKSAHARGDASTAETYLKKAGDISVDAAPAIRVTQAEMMLERGEFRDAETLLMNLHRSNPDNLHIMGLLASALNGTGNTEKLSDLTRIMRSNTQLPVADIEPLEINAWTDILEKSDPADLSKAWNALPGDARKNPDVVEHYARRLMADNRHDTAESVLEKSISATWADNLLATYGELDNDNTAKQLEQLEAWRSRYPATAALSSAMGKLNLKSKNYDKARDCFVNAAQLNLNVDTSTDLGEILDRLGESDKAKDCFRSAAALAQGKDPVGLLLDLKNLTTNAGAQALKKAS